MSPAATTKRPILTPAAFSAYLLEAVAYDRRRDPRNAAQHAMLVRRFVGSAVTAEAFEEQMATECAKNGDLAEVAREILALWRVCTDRRGPIGEPARFGAPREEATAAGAAARDGAYQPQERGLVVA